MLELDDRYRALEAKLRMFQDNLVVLVDLARQRQTCVLEFAVVRPDRVRDADHGVADLATTTLGTVVIVDVVIPALNEEESLPLVLKAIPRDARAHRLRRRQRLDATRRRGWRVQGGAHWSPEPRRGLRRAPACAASIELRALPRAARRRRVPRRRLLRRSGGAAAGCSSRSRAGAADLVIGSRAPRRGASRARCRCSSASAIAWRRR